MMHGNKVKRETLKLRATSVVRSLHEKLIALSHRIHASPEVAFSEVQASGWVAGMLTEGGLEVTRGTYGLATAVEASAGSGSRHIVLCAEYDALPVVGHACGHNIIAAASVGAMLATASVIEELPLGVRFLGTPAEEAGNATGKMLLLDRGAFDNARAALMVHPGPYDVLEPLLTAAASFTADFH